VCHLSPFQPLGVVAVVPVDSVWWEILAAQDVWTQAASLRVALGLGRPPVMPSPSYSFSSSGLHPRSGQLLRVDVDAWGRGDCVGRREGADGTAKVGSVPRAGPRCLLARLEWQFYLPIVEV
jgi:hypothetical protein